jgi:hypothetical protein
VRQSFSGRRLGAVTAMTAVALVGGGLAMAPAASAGTAAAAPATARAPGSQATPNASGPGCIGVLVQFEYDATAARKAICNMTAMVAFVNAPLALASCTSAMSGTGVGFQVTALACTKAAYG